MRTVSRSISLAVLALTAALPLAGCYSNWPPIDGTGRTELNNVHTRGALVAAGAWALDRYKPASAVAFNLPAGLRRSAVLDVIERIGRDSQALTPESAQQLPVFHLARIWIRNDRAELDVIVPTADGNYAMTQLRLVGRFNTWTVEVAREWETLVRPVPDLAYLPETDMPPQPDEPGTIKPWQEKIRGTNLPVEEDGPPN